MLKYRLGIVFIGSSIFGIFVFHLWSLLRYPHCFVDEVWNLNRAAGFLKTGWAFGTQDFGIMNQFPGYWTYFPWVPTALHALSLAIFGSPSLWVVRIVSLVAGVVIVYSNYRIALRVGNGHLPLLTIVVTSLAPVFVSFAHLGRFDVLGTAAAMFGLSLFVLPSTRLKSLIAGFCLALAYEMHPHSAVLAPCFLVVAVYNNNGGFRIWRDPHNYWLTLGVVVGALGYLSLHVFPYPETFFSLQQIFFSKTHTPPILTPSIATVVDAFWHTGSTFMTIYGLMSGAVVWGFVLLIVSRQRIDKLLLGLVLVGVVAFAMLIRHKFAYYYIYLDPLIALLVARTLQIMLSQSVGSKIFVYGTSLALFALTVLIPTLQLIWFDKSTNWKRIEPLVRSLVRDSDVVLGNQQFWLSIPSHIYYSPEALVYLMRGRPGTTIADSIEFLKPDLIILQDSTISLTEAEGEKTGYYYLPREQMLDFLERRANRVGDFETGDYGHVNVYRVSWGAD